MTMRILLLDTGIEWGGGTNSMFELLKRIDHGRFAIEPLFYRNYPKGSASDLKRELAQVGLPLLVLPPLKQPLWAKTAKELVRAFFFWSHTRKTTAVQRIDRRWRILPRARQIAEKLRSGGYDLLYMNNQPSSNQEGYLAAEMAGVPVVQHCRIDVSLTPEEAAITNRIAHRIICVSHGVAQSLARQGIREELLTVIVNAIDGHQSLPAPVPRPAAPGTPVIGTVGQLVARKAVDHILGAIARLPSNISPPHLLVVGEGPARESLAAKAAALGLAERVTFAGFQQQPMAWIAAMDIFVLASAKEGLPRVILEAMLLGKPVIASRVVGSQELVENGRTGLLYEFGDTDAFARHMATLLTDPALGKRLGEAGRSKVLTEYSIEHYVEQVQSVLAAAGRPS
jgi:glycosyltransferase involved in cell wall biosynthesis